MGVLPQTEAWWRSDAGGARLSRQLPLPSDSALVRGAGEGRPAEEARPAILTEVFAQRLSPEAASLLLGAYDEGLGWERVTREVAQGVARRVGGPAEAAAPTPTPSHWYWRGLLAAMALYVMLRPVLSLTRQSR